MKSLRQVIGRQPYRTPHREAKKQSSQGAQRTLTGYPYEAPMDLRTAFPNIPASIFRIPS